MAKKKRRVFNTRLIKRTLSFTTMEVATLLGVHKRTVEEWYRSGLKRIDDHKPFMVHGSDLIAFLDERQLAKKQPCKINELYCVKCRKPQESRDHFVDIRYLPVNRLMIYGSCACCHSPTHKVTSPKRLAELKQVFTVLEVRGEHLLGCPQPIANTDISQKENHEQLQPKK